MWIYPRSSTLHISTRHMWRRWMRGSVVSVDCRSRATRHGCEPSARLITMPAVCSCQSDEAEETHKHVFAMSTKSTYNRRASHDSLATLHCRAALRDASQTRINSIHLRARRAIHSSCSSRASSQCTVLLLQVELLRPGELTGWTTLAALQNTLSAYTLPPATQERL
jgi:hypothetical protein